MRQSLQYLYSVVPVGWFIVVAEVVGSIVDAVSVVFVVDPVNTLVLLGVVTFSLSTAATVDEGAMFVTVVADGLTSP